MSVFYRQSETLFSESDQIIQVDSNHLFLVASENLSWEKLFQELEPVLYGDGKKNVGRHLDLRAHCGAYILQASHNWTDRFTEEMIRYYAPARIFCGYRTSSDGWIDHTKIETFRNRLGVSGAEIMNKYLLQIAKKQKMTKGKNLDTDTTVQETGIAYPSDVNLMEKLRERSMNIVKRLVPSKNSLRRKLNRLQKKGKALEKTYLFVRSGGQQKVKEMKARVIKELHDLTQAHMSIFLQILGYSRGSIKRLRPYLQKEQAQLSKIGPILLEQIKHWIETGKPVVGKVISLTKEVPRFIRKGKLGKPNEIGRKIIVNHYDGGFLSIDIPERPAISDQKILKFSLRQCRDIFGDFPKSFGADRGMYSGKNIRFLKKVGIKEIGLQPKGQARWEVSRKKARELFCRRATIEARISMAGRLGLKISRAKSDIGDMITAHRSIIGYNFKRLSRNWAT